MADRVLYGGPPPADVAKYPPGTVWLEVKQREADATGKTFKVNVYCTNMANYIGYNMGGPGQDMQGGPFIETVHPTAWEYPPSGGAPGLIQTADVVVDNPGFYHIEAQCGEVRAHADVQLGPIDLGPQYDPREVLPNMRERQRRALERDSAFRGTKNIIGAPTRMKRVPR